MKRWCTHLVHIYTNFHVSLEKGLYFPSELVVERMTQKKSSQKPGEKHKPFSSPKKLKAWGDGVTHPRSRGCGSRSLPRREEDRSAGGPGDTEATAGSRSVAGSWVPGLSATLQERCGRSRGGCEAPPSAFQRVNAGRGRTRGQRAVWV